MRPTVFNLLLVVLTAVPSLFGILTFPPTVGIFVSTTVLSSVLFLHLLGKVGILKGFSKPVFAALFLFQLLEGGLKFSLDSLPLTLFGLSQLFIAYLLFWEDSFRKYLYLVLLGFLNLALVSLYYQGLLYGVFLGIYLFLVLYFFLLLAVEAYREVPKKVIFNLLKYASLTYLVVFAFGTLLFFLLPRPTQPLFTFLHKEVPKPKIAFSNEISLGQFSEVVEDPTVVFRAKIFPPPKRELYWRGNTLERFDGKRWYPSKVPYASSAYTGGKTFKVELLLSPYGDKNLFTYGYPLRIEEATLKEIRIDRSKNVVLSKEIIAEPAKVSLTTSSPSSFRIKLTREDLLLEVPDAVKTPLEEVIRKNNLKGGGFYDTYLRLKKFFSQFRYSATNPAKDLVQFLNLYKRGNCEYFASASALLFRMLGYPSRVVVGFYGGELNPMTGYYVIRQKDAHAWTEVLVNGRWVRFDATKFVSTDEKINQTVRVSLQKSKLLMFLDMVDTLWLEYVVNLNREKQGKILKKVLDLSENLKEKFERFLPYFAGSAFLLFVFGILRNPKRFLFWIFRLYLLFKERIPWSAGRSPISLYNFLWRERPGLFLRYRRILKKLVA